MTDTQESVVDKQFNLICDECEDYVRIARINLLTRLVCYCTDAGDLEPMEFHKAGVLPDRWNWETEYP